MGLLARSVPLPRWQGGVGAAVRERAGGGGCGEPQRLCWNEAGGSAPRYKFSTRTAPRPPLRMRLVSGVWEGRGARVRARGFVCARVGVRAQRASGKVGGMGCVCEEGEWRVLCAWVCLSWERGRAGGAGAERGRSLDPVTGGERPPDTWGTAGSGRSGAGVRGKRALGSLFAVVPRCCFSSPRCREGINGTELSWRWLYLHTLRC